MFVKILVDLETLESFCEDIDTTVNEIKTENGKLLIEISKPDPESTITTTIE